MNKKRVTMFCGLLLVILGSLLAMNQMNSSKEIVASRTIKIVDIEGEALIERGDLTDISAYENMLLESGDIITVQEDSYLRLLIDTDKYIYVSESTTLSLIASGDQTDSNTEVIVTQGTIINELVSELSSEASYKVTTPNASLSVRGTIFGVEVYQKDDLYYTDLLTYEGSVSSMLVHEDGSMEQEVLVDVGFAVKIESDEETYVEYVLYPVDDGELWDIDITTISDAMLNLLLRQAMDGIKTGLFSIEEIRAEIARRQQVVSYELTTIVQGKSTTYSYEANQTLQLKTPTQQGFTFVGWYSNADYKTSFQLTKMPEQDTTIYALFEINNYTVSLNDGSKITESSQEYKKNLELTTPTKMGYTFIGWYDQENSEWTKNDLVPSYNLQLEARWQANGYTLTLNDGDITTIEVEYGTELELPTLTKTGYTFMGWYQDDIQWQSGDTMPASDITLTASWKINSYTLTLDNDDTDISEVEYGAELELPTLTKTGYTFMGWYQDGVQWQSGDTMPARDIILTSSWKINSYTLTLDNDDTDTSEVEYGAELELPTLTKTGYTFMGWYQDGVQWQSGDTMPASDITLTASWKINSYTLTLDNDDTDISEVEYGTELELPALTKTGYTFMGWYQDGVQWQSGDTMPASDITLTASWKINSYTLTLDNDDTDISEVEYGAELELPTVTKTGYSASEWEDDQGNQYETMPAKNIVLTPIWVVETYEFKMVSALNNMSNTWLSNQQYGTALYDSVILVNAAKHTSDYYYIEGYYTDDSFDAEYRIDATYTMPAYEITIYAHWVPNEYDLTLVNGDSSSVTVYDYNEEITLSTLSKEGYEFNGWLDSDGVKWDSGDTMPGNNLTLTASWTTKTYTLTINYTDVETDNVYTVNGVEYNSSIYQFNNEKTGYTVDEFYVLDETNRKVSLSDTATMPASNYTVYTDDEANYYDVTLYYSTEDSESTVSVQYGTSVLDAVLDNASTDSGLATLGSDSATLYGWAEDESLNTIITSSTYDMPAEDTTIYAVWLTNYQLTVDNTEIAKIAETTYISYLSEEQVNETDSNGQAWRFVGWKYADNETMLTSYEMPSHDLSVESVWEEVYLVSFVDGSSTTTVYYAPGETIDLLKLQGTSDYFAGWSIDGGIADDDTVITSYTMGSSDVTMEAIYLTTSANVVEMELFGTTITRAFDTYPFDLSTINPTENGYTFSNWIDDTNTEIPSVTGTGITASATWSMNSYNITIGDDSDIDCTIENLPTLPSLSSDVDYGYHTIVWQNTTTGKVYNPGDKITIADLVDGKLNSYTFVAILTPKSVKSDD